MVIWTSLHGKHDFIHSIQWAVEPATIALVIPLKIEPLQYCFLCQSPTQRCRHLPCIHFVSCLDSSTNFIPEVILGTYATYTASLDVEEQLIVYA